MITPDDTTFVLRRTFTAPRQRVFCALDRAGGGGAVVAPNQLFLMPPRPASLTGAVSR